MLVEFSHARNSSKLYTNETFSFSWRAHAISCMVCCYLGARFSIRLRPWLRSSFSAALWHGKTGLGTFESNSVTPNASTRQKFHMKPGIELRESLLVH